LSAPLVITLKIDAQAQAFFDALRRQHFPAHINYLEAHLTLFHKLPSTEPMINEVLEAVAQRKIFSLNVPDVKHIGNGVAYAIRSATVQEMHLQLQKRFNRWLTGQDRKRIWPHITIQNKVTAFKSMQLYTELKKDFKPFEIKATGLSTWRYLKGPWEHLSDFDFREEPVNYEL